MPPLVPSPSYGPDVPEVHDFYERLTRGLDLTLDGEFAARQHHLDEAAGSQPEVEAARQLVADAEQAYDAALAPLTTLRAGSRPWTGERALADAVKVAKATLLLEHEQLRAVTTRQDIERREAALRAGAARPRSPWQHGNRKVGGAKYGVYAFYDYDGHALYVGKTIEGVRVRVRRHLTNQRTDAVAMSVLDPLEVVEVEVWPLWPDDDPATTVAYIGSLEYAVAQMCVAAGANLFNEKRILAVTEPPPLPASVRFDVLSPENRSRLGHPDLRIARRLAISARLGSRIAERSLRNIGLRRSLQRQLARLNELADARFLQLGGEAGVSIDEGKDDPDDEA